MKQLLSRGTNGTGGYTRPEAVVQGPGSEAASRIGLALKDPVAAYLVVLIAVAAGFATLSAIAGYGIGEPWAVLILGAVAAASEKQRVAIGRDTVASISLIPIILAAVLFGPLAAMVVAAISNLGAFERPYMKWAVFTCSHSITGAIAGFVAAATLTEISRQPLAYIVATSLTAIAAELCQIAFLGVTMRMRGKSSVEAIAKVAPVASASLLIYVPLAAVLVVAYVQVSPFTLPLFLAPALAAQRLFVMYQKQLHLAESLERANVRLERANLTFITELVSRMDARDPWGAGHSAAVAIYARDIAERLGLSEEEQRLTHFCGLVHDIGKVGLRPGLLEKPGALTPEERLEMQSHSEIGEHILAKNYESLEVARIVRHHHERWDGGGYPDGLAGEAIPLISRIICVADAYNAMTSDRPYRDAMATSVARVRLAQSVESQFDTRVVAAFEAVLAGADESYLCGTRSDFTLAEQDRYSDGKEEESPVPALYAV